MKFLLKNVLPKVNADAARSSLQQKGNSLPRAWGNEKWSFEMATAMVLLDCCSDTKNILHNIQVKKDRKDGKRGGVTKRTPMQSPKCLARKYYEKCHQLRELVNDTTKKQRVEDWDQLLFVKKDDTLEQQNQCAPWPGEAASSLAASTKWFRRIESGGDMGVRSGLKFTARGNFNPSLSHGSAPDRKLSHR